MSLIKSFQNLGYSSKKDCFTVERPGDFICADWIFFFLQFSISFGITLWAIPLTYLKCLPQSPCSTMFVDKGGLNMYMFFNCHRHGENLVNTAKRSNKKRLKNKKKNTCIFQVPLPLLRCTRIFTFRASCINCSLSASHVTFPFPS